MKDNEENRVTVNMAIYSDTADRIAQEATRIKRARPSERKPSAAKVIERAWRAYEAAGRPGDEPVTGTKPLDGEVSAEIQSSLERNHRDAAHGDGLAAAIKGAIDKSKGARTRADGVARKSRGNKKVDPGRKEGTG